MKRGITIFLLIIFLSASASGDWVRLKLWQGSGIKKTESFNVTSEEWRIIWNYKTDNPYGGAFSIFVNEKNGSSDMVANQSNSGEGSSYMHHPGTFWLDISALGSWVVTVESPK